MSPTKRSDPPAAIVAALHPNGRFTRRIEIRSRSDAASVVAGQYTVAANANAVTGNTFNLLLYTDESYFLVIKNNDNDRQIVPHRRL